MSKQFIEKNSRSFSEREILKRKYYSSRWTLMIVAVITILNIISLAIGSGRYYLFSAFIPFYIVSYGMYRCGMLPEEAYLTDYNVLKFADKSMFAVALVVAILITLIYVLCWILSKNMRVGGIIAGLIFFVVDTVVMFMVFGTQRQSLLDYIMHILVIVLLSNGIRAFIKHKNLPEELFVKEYEVSDEDTQAIRAADDSVKGIVFVEAEYMGYKITYRRVKRVIELVINGLVYAEYDFSQEKTRYLRANIGGHVIAGGNDGKSHRFIKVDGETIARKFSW